MSNPTVKVHPLGEILSRKLFGIEGVPRDEQSKMVSRAITAAKAEYDKLQAENEKLRTTLKASGEYILKLEQALKGGE